MPGKQLFEYAIIRVVPRVEREEFMNVGVILYCRDLKFLQCLHRLNMEKLTVLCKETDCSEVEKHLLSFQRISDADPGAGPIALLDTASRFRWLTATRSTVVQTSKVHPGFCDDPKQTVLKLYEQFVL